MITYNTTKNNFLKAVNKYKKVSIYNFKKSEAKKTSVHEKKNEKIIIIHPS